MKRMIQLMLAALTGTAAFAQTNFNTVNAIIGDISYIQRFEELPSNQTNETIRIQTHLSHVEVILEQTDVSHLSITQQSNRHHILQLLNQYMSNGVFPKNVAYAERRPCFIDSDGNICAVGYLIEQTAGREVAERINAQHQYDFLLDMNEKIIADWATKNGLTLQECAMIQPAYGTYPPDETYNVPLKTGYGIGSGFVGGVNVGVNIINLSNRSFAKSKTLSYIGLLSGTSQIVMGLTNIKKDETEIGFGTTRNISYKAQNNLSYINIAAGTTTVLTSAFNLFINSKMKDRRNAFNLYSYPDASSKLVTGLAFTRSL